MTRKLTPTTIRRRLKAKGLNATPEEIQQLTDMMNAEADQKAKDEAAKAKVVEMVRASRFRHKP